MNVNKSVRDVGLAVCLTFTAVSGAGTLTVPLHGQEQDQWCWAASSQMVLQYYGHEVEQSAIADWAVGGLNQGNAIGAQKTGPYLSIFPPKIYYKLGAALVLNQFGPVTSNWQHSSLSSADIEKEINGGRPAILAVRWLQRDSKTKSLKDAGGHAIVLRGFESGNLISLRDPWPVNSGNTYLVTYDSLFTADSTYFGSATLGNRWSETLKTGRSLDLCFLIDSTGSMSDDIAAVKVSARDLIDEVIENYPDARFAVVDYRDYPSYPTGDDGDWITKRRSAFTSDPNAARNAINAISAGGGSDWPEAVFSAVSRTMSGSEIGAWRPNVERRIILMGDAPGHDPEPWAGGTSYGDVIAQWNGLTDKIAIHALSIGGDNTARDQFTALAGATGGGTRFADAASGVSGAMSNLIAEFAQNPRFPQGVTKAFKPVFTFVTPSESMLPPVKNVFVETQVFDSKKKVWKNYKKVTLPSTASTWTPTATLPIGSYQWRIGFKRDTGKFALPSGVMTTVKGMTIMEADWTGFSRAQVDPARCTQLAPVSAFSPSTTSVTYMFSSAVNAEKYLVEVYTQDSKGVWKKWKSQTVTPPSKNPLAAVLSVKVSGHKVGKQYRWRVQSLNFDRPKAIAGAWVGLP